VSRESKRSPWVRRGVVAVVIIGLLVAMGLSTTVTTAEKGAAVASGLDPAKDFNPADFAAKTFATVQAELPAKAVEIAVLAPAVAANLAEAGTKYGQDLGAGSYAVPVKATGSVTNVDKNFITLQVDGMPADVGVAIPVGTAMNGGPIRDALGNVKFGDVPDQIAYQTVAQDIKKLVATQIVGPINPTSLQGKTITVYGAWKSGGPKSTFIIQPVQIEVGS
jgi:predicted lipoprotein